MVLVSKPVLRSSQFPASLFDASICSPGTPAPAQECAQAEPSLVEAERQNKHNIFIFCLCIPDYDNFHFLPVFSFASRAGLTK